MANGFVWEGSDPFRHPAARCRPASAFPLYETAVVEKEGWPPSHCERRDGSSTAIAAKAAEGATAAAMDDGDSDDSCGESRCRWQS